MCVTLKLPDGRELTQTEELRQLMGEEPPWLGGYEDLAGEDVCLCPINLDRAAEVLGYRLTWQGETVIATRRCDA